MNNISIPLPREMISDSLKGVLDDKEMVKAYEETFITVLLANSEKSKCMIGSLVGIELIDLGIKIDCKVSLEDAFNFITNFALDEVSKELRAIILSLGDRITKLTGPYVIHGLKIVEIDSTSRLCVLAVDLFNKKLETTHER